MCFAAIGGLFLGAGASTAAATSLGVTIVGGVVSTGMTLMTQYQGYQDKKAAAQFQQQQFDANKVLVQQAMLTESRGIIERQRQEDLRASQLLRENKIKEAQTMGTFLAAGGDTKVAGLSEVLLLADIERMSLNNEQTINRNFEYVNKDLQNRNEGIYQKAIGRIQSVPQGVMPSLTNTIIGTGLQIGGDLFAGYDKYMERTGGYLPDVYNTGGK
jgi:hypothetical protein